VAFVRGRPDFTYRGAAWLFAGFILFCGATHLFGIWTLWQPLYWAEGAIKAATALISVATAILPWPLLPKALTLPSPAALRAANATLELRMGGPKVLLSPPAALQLGMALHELTTNATRDGALSVAAGRVEILWEVERQECRLCWQEQSGPAVTAPARKGFGCELIEWPAGADRRRRGGTRSAPWPESKAKGVPRSAPPAAMGARACGTPRAGPATRWPSLARSSPICRAWRNASSTSRRHGAPPLMPAR
jgi:hypothetical protein